MRIPDLHSELLSGVLTVSSCSGLDLTFVKVDGKCSLQLAGPLYGHKLYYGLGVGGHFMTILSHGVRNAHSEDRLLNVLLLG